MRNVSISLWQSFKPVSKVAVWWKYLDLFFRRTSIEVPFVDLTQVMSVNKFFNENVSHKSDRYYFFFVWDVYVSVANNENVHILTCSKTQGIWNFTEKKCLYHDYMEVEENKLETKLF